MPVFSFYLCALKLPLHPFLSASSSHGDACEHKACITFFFSFLRSLSVLSWPTFENTCLLVLPTHFSPNVPQYLGLLPHLPLKNSSISLLWSATYKPPPPLHPPNSDMHILQYTEGCMNEDHVHSLHSPLQTLAAAL